MPALNPSSTRWAAQWGQCRCLQGQDLCNGTAHITPAACTSLCFLLMQNTQEACPGQEEQLPLCSQSSGTPQSQNGLGWIKDHRVPAPCHGQGGGVWLVPPSLVSPKESGWSDQALLSPAGADWSHINTVTSAL